MPALTRRRALNALLIALAVVVVVLILLIPDTLHSGTQWLQDRIDAL